jgi:hypothetical protein
MTAKATLRDRTILRLLVLESRPIQVGVVVLNVATLNVVILLVRLDADVSDYAALGVFFRVQVTDFDLCFGFFSLCHFCFCFFLCCLVPSSFSKIVPGGTADLRALTKP